MYDPTISCKLPQTSPNSKEELSELIIIPAAFVGILISSCLIDGISTCIERRLEERRLYLQQQDGLRQANRVLANQRDREQRESLLSTDSTGMSEQIVMDISGGDQLEQSVTAISEIRQIAQEQEVREIVDTNFQQVGNAVLQSNPVERIVGTALEESV